MRMPVQSGLGLGISPQPRITKICQLHPGLCNVTTLTMVESGMGNGPMRMGPDHLECSQQGRRCTQGVEMSTRRAAHTWLAAVRVRCVQIPAGDTFQNRIRTCVPHSVGVVVL